MSILGAIFQGIFEGVKEGAVEAVKDRNYYVDDLDEDEEYLDPEIYCQECGNELLNLGKGVRVCSQCGKEYQFDYDGYDEEDYSTDILDMPEVCRTCGGEYPDCMDSCKLFDD